MFADRPERAGRLVLDEVDSTNSEALRRARDLAPPVWIMARRQTSARGRRGRAWHGPEGNFAASLICRPDEPADRAARLSFVAALAVYDALDVVTGGNGLLTLKWPNDVLLNGGKVAGILLESASSGATLDRLVIGIGVNLASAPSSKEVEPGALRPVSVQDETGVAVAQDAFLDHLADAYAVREAEYRRDGFAALRDLWLARAARLGEAIVARSGGETLRGRFETVDLAGALVLDTADGRRSVAAADIFF